MQLLQIVITFAVLIGLLGGGTMWRLRQDKHRRDAARDDLVRAGETPDLGPEEAALRAEGQAAWMRPGGF